MKLIQIKLFLGFLLFNIIYTGVNRIRNFENTLTKQELNDNKKKSILLSSKKINRYNLENKYILYNNNKYFEKENKYIFLNSLNDNTLSDSTHNDYKVKVFFHLNTNEDLNEFIEKNHTSSDSFFKKIISHSKDYGFNNVYYNNITDKYYLYVKKYYGNVDFYKYKGELNPSSDISDNSKFKKPIISYQDSNQYTIINNQLITIQGNQFISFFYTYNSLTQIYFQNYDDKTNIQNGDLYLFKNLVKLLIKDKTYNFNFNVNHLIKLDDNFIDSEVTFTDENGKEYKLNKANKIIKIKADKLSVVASKDNAFIYCYSNYSEYRTDPFKIIEFDKNKSGKIMKFTIENNNDSNFIIIKDFGFEGYSPTLYYTSFDKIIVRENNDDKYNTVYVENLYDKYKELYEDENYKEKYYIYVFEKYDEEGIPFYNNENITFGEPEYINNLMTPGNKYNFEVIPGNSNGGILLNSLSKEKVNYQFFKCNNNKIKFEISSSNSYLKDKLNNGPYQEDINENKDISMSVNKNEILMHTFESENEFLFIYSFNDGESNLNDNTDKLTDLKIDVENKNKKLTIKFTPNYKKTLTKYFIIISQKNETMTEDNFSNPCFIANLIINTPKDIKIINVLDLGEKDLITEEVDISNIPSKSNEYLINIVSQELEYEKLNFYSPKTHKINKKGKTGDDEDDDDDNDYKSFFIALGCIFGSLILIIIIIYIIFFIRKKAQEKLLAEVNQISFAEDREQNEYQTSILD